MYRYGVKSNKSSVVSRLGAKAKQGLRLFWGPLAALVFVVSPLGVFAKGGLDSNPPTTVVSTYSASVYSKSFSDNTLNISSSFYVNNFVGREDEQYAKFTWGDGAVESNKLMNLPGYLKSSKTLTISSLSRSHTYPSDTSWLVNVKVYYGDSAGNELNATQLGQYSFETENTITTCRDNSDNDKDGPKDLLDNDCQKFRHIEDTATLCSDNIDNDINGKTDLLDPNCAAFIPTEDNAVACSDGLDNDLDGKVDLFDSSCASFTPPENTAATCSDGFDNDFDGKADMLDSECLQFAPPENTTALCTDGIDNDFDGLKDGLDADCIGQVPTENNAAVCLDGIDNDFDGKLDWNDADCAAFAQPSNCPVGFIAFFIPGFGFICGASAGY